MSTSEHDTESTFKGSPRSHLESPFSSPSQQVPQLAYSMTELTCTDSNFINGNNGRPYLRILEQPQNHFRFRYKSEMVGTHGCLLGESYATSKTKTHPTVELVNYTGRAITRCQLAQHKTPDEHPHKLLEEEQDRDVSYEVPEHGSYKVGFAGMGIIHTAKKDVPGLLFKKYVQTIKDPQFNQKNLRTHCENEAKAIDLNIVRLRFSAHDILTDKEICPPVFSRPIYNMKCAATNDLKICRISRSCGRARGGDDVFLLVEKVNKKNIMVRLFELNENGEETWSSVGHFPQSDVHHQYAIVFRTPPYQDPHTPVDKKVFIELVRPSDGRTSEPKEFKYKAAPAAKIGKKRKPNYSYSSLSSSGGSLRSTGDVPVTALLMNPLNDEHSEIENNDVHMFTISQIPQIPKPSPFGASDLGEAILYGIRAEGSPSENHFYDSPMMPQGVTEPPNLQLNSAELDRILRDNPSIPADEKERFAKTDWSEYLKLYADSLNDENNTYSMEFDRSMLVSDSGRGVKLEAGCSKAKQIKQEDQRTKSVDYTKGNIEYTAFYKSEDGNEVKKLVKELCEIIREKPLVNKQIVRAKLERLFEMRLSNGDTFLHMTLCSRQPSLDYIIKLIHSMKMTRLLNLTNYQSQTILHLAVIHDMPKIVPFLISKGCNPMIEDSEGNNVVHNAVICQSCLEPLLDACKRNSVSYDLNAYNNEKQTALHLAVIYKSESSIRLLLKHGASYNARDSDGRTALHLAAYDDCLPAALALADHVPPSEIDALDGRGYTALQVVCDGEIRENTLKMVNLLLEKKADPLKSEPHASSAWKLSKDKPAIRDILRAYLPPMYDVDDEIKSEPEDEFESADEGESQDQSLSELPLYLNEVSDILDATGGWRMLACKLDMQTLHSWYSNTDSPTRTLLLHVKFQRKCPDCRTDGWTVLGLVMFGTVWARNPKNELKYFVVCNLIFAAAHNIKREPECGDSITSKVLAVTLEEIGEFDAANIIRRYID